MIFHINSCQMERRALNVQCCWSIGPTCTSYFKGDIGPRHCAQTHSHGSPQLCNRWNVQTSRYVESVGGATLVPERHRMIYPPRTCAEFFEVRKVLTASIRTGALPNSITQHTGINNYHSHQYQIITHYTLIACWPEAKIAFCPSIVDRERWNFCTSSLAAMQ